MRQPKNKFKKRGPRFQASFKGRELTEAVRSLPSSGIRYAPIMEAGLAAQWAHYKTFEFFDLDVKEQAFVIALYRAAHAIEAVSTHDAMKKANRKKK